MVQYDDLESFIQYAPAEILEHILLYLDCQDITCAQITCRNWSACIKGLSSLQLRLYKLPIPYGSDETIHFEDLIDETRGVKIRSYEFEGQNLWELVRRFEDLEIQEAQDRTWDDLQEYWNTHRHNDHRETYDGRMLDIRTGFNYVRRENGSVWPIGIKELYCEWCDQWHTGFRFEHLHPLFRFLGEGSLYLRGNGSGVMSHFSLKLGFMDNRSTFSQGYKNGLTVAKGLAKVYRAISDDGAANNLFSQPPLTKIASGYLRVVHNENGFTLQDVLAFFVEEFCACVYGWRDELTEIKHRYIILDDVCWQEGLQYIEDWVTAARFWEEIITQIEGIMSGIPDRQRKPEPELYRGTGKSSWKEEDVVARIGH